MTKTPSFLGHPILLQALASGLMVVGAVGYTLTLENHREHPERPFAKDAASNAKPFWAAMKAEVEKDLVGLARAMRTAARPEDLLWLPQAQSVVVVPDGGGLTLLWRWQSSEVQRWHNGFTGYGLPNATHQEADLRRFYRAIEEERKRREALPGNQRHPLMVFSPQSEKLLVEKEGLGFLGHQAAGNQPPRRVLRALQVRRGKERWVLRLGEAGLLRVGTQAGEAYRMPIRLVEHSASWVSVLPIPLIRGQLALDRMDDLLVLYEHRLNGPQLALSPAETADGPAGFAWPEDLSFAVSPRHSWPPNQVMRHAMRGWLPSAGAFAAGLLLQIALLPGVGAWGLRLLRAHVGLLLCAVQGMGLLALVAGAAAVALAKEPIFWWNVMLMLGIGFEGQMMTSPGPLDALFLSLCAPPLGALTQLQEQPLWWLVVVGLYGLQLGLVARWWRRRQAPLRLPVSGDDPGGL